MSKNSVIGVDVWKFGTAMYRNIRDFNNAKSVGRANSWEELVSMTSGYGYYGYTDPDSGQWLTYAEVGKLFDQEPWRSM